MYTSKAKADRAYAAYRAKEHDTRPRGNDGRARFRYDKK
jgi:hypothetical protein